MLFIGPAETPTSVHSLDPSWAKRELVAEVALIALARKLLTILNAMVRDRTDWQKTTT